MTTYTAPLRDMLFTMKEVAGLDAVCAQPGFEDATPDLVEAILDEAAKFAAGVLDPLNAPGDRQGVRWKDGVVTAADGFALAYASFCETGWNAMPARVELGHLDLRRVLRAMALAESDGRRGRAERRVHDRHAGRTVGHHQLASSAPRRISPNSGSRGASW